MEPRAKRFTYRTAVEWKGQKRGTMTAIGKPDIEVATPPEFKGHESIWSPEDLFVASINACIMSTFLAMAERGGLAFESYRSEAVGTLEMVDNQFQITTVSVRPSVKLKAPEATSQAEELLAKAEANCLISHSVKSRVAVESTIL